MRTYLTQAYSFRRARQYFYDALTLPNADNREMFLARTFYTLGHVIHLIQDAAQPQHTRNDSHGGGPFGPRSRFEFYTNEAREVLPFSNQDYHKDSPVIFDNARKYWHTSDGQGMAQFSSFNFLSAGTNFDTIRYPYPKFEEAVPWDDNANNLLQPIRASLPPECLAPNQPCRMTFFRTPIRDNYRPRPEVNERASTVSIFDQDLKAYNRSYSFTDPDTGQVVTTNDVFSLNRFNFDAAHEFLIPRAVAYSAGLIDYFFRGRLAGEDVEFTETGIRLRVKNAIDAQATPAWANKILYANSGGGNGSLVLAFE